MAEKNELIKKGPMGHNRKYIWPGSMSCHSPRLILTLMLPEAILREQYETKKEPLFWSDWLNCTHTLGGPVICLNWNVHLSQICTWIFSLQGFSQCHYPKLTNGFIYFWETILYWFLTFLQVF